jgi:hypothetical protein
MKSVLFLVLLLSQASFAENLFQYSFDGYPKTHSDCKTAARELANEFGKALGVTITGSKCRRANIRSYDLDVFYSAGSEPLINSSGRWGIYRSYQNCQAALAGEKEFIQKTEGLSSFMSYCAEDGETGKMLNSQSRYTPVVLTLGSPKAVVRTLALVLYDGAYLGSQRELQEIFEKSQQEGLPLVNLNMDELDYNSQLWLRFAFSPEEAKKNLERIYHVKTGLESFFSTEFETGEDPMHGTSKEQCEIQKAYAEKTFNPYFSKPVVWFCMWDKMLERSHLYHLRINPDETSFKRITPGKDGEPFANEYETREECEKDRPNVMKYYQEKLGHQVVGGLCSWKLNSQDSIKLFLYALERD